MPSTVTFHPLQCHIAAADLPKLAIAATVDFAEAGGLILSYRWRGDLDALRLPPVQTPTAMDGLWQHSCCEAFVAAVDVPGYHEFNFSPSGCWAAYRFTGYRQRDDSWLAASAPRIRCEQENGLLRLEAHIPAALLPSGKALRLGLTAVVEARNGEKSYWALHHPGPTPDFHLRDSFVLELNRP